MEGSCSFKRVVREASLRQWYKNKEPRKMREVNMGIYREKHA